MFEPITNPYIVGNPIKTKKMFYGREDDFEFIKRKLESGSKSYIIVLSGERRSGKTSILFQILNGQLGDNFIPILIDMQTMAGLKNESEFFEKFAQETLKYLDDRFLLQNYNFHSSHESPYKVFSRLLDDMHQAEPKKTKLFLIDEYELIESKSEEGSVSPNFVPFLSGVLESERRVSFIFTGSRTLEERKNNYWQNLFGKSLFRNVSFLSEQDTMRLIRQPVEGRITYSDEVLKNIYRLTAGQPFYTQIVGQNIVDFVNEKQKIHIEREDLDQIVNEILENPLPQMIYFWNSLPQSQMLMLSLLSEILVDPDQQITANEITKQSKKKKLGITLDHQLISTILETLYHQNYVSKTGDTYSFQIDLLRQWIKRDHSIWRVMKEVDIASIIESERPSSSQELTDSGTQVIQNRKKWFIPAAVIIVLLVISTVWYMKQTGNGQSLLSKVESEKQVEPPLLDKEQPITDTLEKSEELTESIAPKQTTKPVKDEFVENKKLKPESPDRNIQTHSAQKQEINPVDKIQPIKSAMQTSKDQAILAKAPKFADDTFQKGIDAEIAAVTYLDHDNYQEASNKYQQAQKYFEEATNESRTAVEKAQNNIENILQELNKVQKDIKPEHHSMAEYQDAEVFRSEGANYKKNGDYIQAYSSYSKAVSLYQEAIRKAIIRKEKINDAINSYARAIENKNFNTSSGILSGYKKELQDEWQPFFKVAENINIVFDINDVLFAGNTASALVDILMKYTGAGGSGTKNKWKFELVASNSDWLISNVSEAN